MPSGENPWNQILASNRRRSKGDLGKLQGKLWHAVNCCSIGIDERLATGDQEAARKWINSLAQVSTVYLKVVLDGDVERRLKQVEEAMAHSQETGYSGTYSPARRK